MPDKQKALGQLRAIEQSLGKITLPSLKRVDLGPDGEPTEARVQWLLRLYALSLIAHMRTILAGYILLADAGNKPAGDILARHIFEWAAHACYMERELKKHLAASDFEGAHDLLLGADTANRWIKQHGSKYKSATQAKQIPSFPESESLLTRMMNFI